MRNTGSNEFQPDRTGELAFLGAGHPLSPCDLLTFLQRGQIQLADIPSMLLLQKGTEAVGGGDFATRDALYSLVSQHPDVSPDEVALVEIHNADMKRRLNTTDDLSEAQRMLENIHHSGGNFLEAQRLQAISQVHLFRYKSSNEAEDLSQAIEASRSILPLIDVPTIDIPKRAFYLGSFVGIKQIAGEYDDEMMDALKLSSSYVLELNDSNPFKLKELSQIHLRFGNLFQHQGEYIQAFESYYQSYQLSPTNYYKLDGAIEGLLASEKLPSEPFSGVSIKVEELKSFIPQAYGSLNDIERPAFTSRIEALKDKLN